MIVVSPCAQADAPPPAALGTAFVPSAPAGQVGGDHRRSAAAERCAATPLSASAATLPPTPLPAACSLPSATSLPAASQANLGLRGAASSDALSGMRNKVSAFARPRSVVLYGAVASAGLLLGAGACGVISWYVSREEAPLPRAPQAAADSRHTAAPAAPSPQADRAQQQRARTPANVATAAVGPAAEKPHTPSAADMQPAKDTVHARHDRKAGEADEVSTAPAEQPPGERMPGPQDEQVSDAQPQAGTAQSSRQPSRRPPRARPGRNGKAPGGLAGVSRQYDDLQCQQIQARHGVRVPPGAAIIEIDGQRLPIENVAALAECRAPFVFLPRGRHVVRFRANEWPVEVHVEGHLGEEYRAMRAWFGFPSRPRAGDLLQRSAWAFDVHGAPFLLHLMGSLHARQDDLAAAERKFRRALRVNAAFAPAHLNLAHCLLKRGAQQEAVREVLLAEAFNVGNVFGLARQIAECKRACGITSVHAVTLRLEPQAYLGSEPMDVVDERMVALLEGLAKYAIEDRERAKILNNLAVHFADSGKTELALEYFRNALAVLKFAGPERFDVARQVFTNMSAACRKAAFAEAAEYEQMLELVLP